MENKPYIRVGGKIFAIAHIVAIFEVGNGDVRLWTLADAEPWNFTGNEAKALAAWAKTLPCEDLMKEEGE